MTSSPSPRHVHRLAAVVWLTLSVAALASLARGGYAIGLDFEGGATLGLVPNDDDGRCDPRAVDAVMRARHGALAYELQTAGNRCRLSFTGLTDEPTVDAVARTLLAEHAAPLAVEERFVIAPAFAPVLGRPTALGLGAAATLLWGATLVNRVRAIAVVGAAVTTLVVGLAWVLGLGSTLGRASYLAALWFVPAITTLTATSGRPRFRRGLVGLLLFAGLVIAAAVVQTLEVRASSELVWVRAGARLALTIFVPAVALALLAIWSGREE
ncbi:hypothetical protein [Nannocystis punicea]|uniref:Uncharacterized protein n=1 Tax=Nannocystis punicea TaxID=2995304 RepID=A0ABY7GT12_9BACT|nr:hypothetical protein [Nannocystis poenicansa]WAS90009.1 hypothetical protein O0S08_27765 [Nannocystis poenicansa]